MNVAFRAATPEDLRFVVSAWSSSFKASHFAGMLYTDDWAAVMHPTIERLIARAGTRTIVAFDRARPGFIFGFIAGDTSGPEAVVHYVYVKEPYRLEGIARRLLAELGISPDQRFTYTYRTGIVRRLIDAGKVPRADWNPLIARYPAADGRKT